MTDPREVAEPVVMQRKEIGFCILLAVFVCCMGAVNILSAKLWTFAGLAINSGIIMYWITFPITDVIGEVYGRRRATLVVWLGFGAALLIVLLSQIIVALPAHPNYAQQGALETTIGIVPVMVFASLSAYICAQTHDVAAFAFWRNVTNGKHLWLRNTLSTTSSQLIDSVVFNGLAFYLLATSPLPFAEILTMTLALWVFKIAIAILDTPIVYGLGWLLKRESAGPVAKAQS